MNVNPLAQERVAFEAALFDTGLNIPPDASRPALRATVVQQYTPTESYGIYRGDYDSMSAGTQAYLRFEVAPAVWEGIERKDEKMIKLGWAAGRYLAAAFETGKANFDPALDIGREKITIAGQTFPIAFEQGRVVEYGMGVNGLMAHMENLRSEPRPYTVAGLTNYVGEVMLLDGVADYFGVGEGVINDAGGIAGCVGDMLGKNSEYKGGVDLLVMSSINSRSLSFLEGIEKASELLRPGGMVVAVGLPDSDKEGIGYRRIGKRLSKDRQLAVEVSRDFLRPLPKQETVLNTLTVARKLP